MVRTDAWKYVHFNSALPMLFDLVNDPQERRDLGRDGGYAAVRSEMKDRLFDWMMNRRLRVTKSDAAVEVDAVPPKPLITGWPIGV